MHAFHHTSITDEQIHKRGVAITAHTVKVQGEVVSQTVHIQKGHILNNQPTHMAYTNVSPHRSEMVSIAKNWSMPRPWSAVCHDHGVLCATTMECCVPRPCLSCMQVTEWHTCTAQARTQGQRKRTGQHLWHNVLVRIQC